MGFPITLLPTYTKWNFVELWIEIRGNTIFRCCLKVAIWLGCNILHGGLPPTTLLDKRRLFWISIQIPTCRRCFGVCSRAQAPKWSWLEPPPLVASGVFEQAVKAIYKKAHFLGITRDAQRECIQSIHKCPTIVLSSWICWLWAVNLKFKTCKPQTSWCVPWFASQPKQTGDHTPNSTSNRVYLSPSLRT